MIIDAWRREIVTTINECLQESVILKNIGEMSLVYEPGWSGQSLLDELEMGWDRDLELGYTRLGVHRADARLRINSKEHSRRLSRGQLKVAAVEIMLGLRRFILGKTGLQPVILVDDVQAELDKMMRQALVGKILDLSGQKFFTAIDKDLHPEIFTKADMVFHVEQKTINS